MERNNMPLYMVLANDIRSNILLGSYANGIPSEVDLCKKYGVSRLTIRNSLRQLIEWNEIYAVAGKGYFPCGTKDIKFYFGTNSYNLPINIDSAELLNVNVIKPDIYQVYEFKIHPDSKLLMVATKLFCQNELAGYEKKYLPYYAGMPLVDNDLQVLSLEKIIGSKYPEAALEKK